MALNKNGFFDDEIQVMWIRYPIEALLNSYIGSSHEDTYDDAEIFHYKVDELKKEWLMY